MNRIYNVSFKEITPVVETLKSLPNTHLVEIDGNNIQSWKEYIAVIENGFKFPTSCIDTMCGYSDWIRDLEWLKKDAYSLVIYDYNKFLRKDKALKRIIMEDFRDSILPWWQEDVVKYVVEGKAKQFNIYLVD
jgi:hypothetical protein